MLPAPASVLNGQKMWRKRIDVLFDVVFATMPRLSGTGIITLFRGRGAW